MKVLKRIAMMLLTGTSLFYMASCGNVDDAMDATAVGFDDVTVDTEASMDVAFEDVDNSVEAGINYEATEGGKFFHDPLLECAVVTHDRDSNTVTIDYGDGCEGPGGRIRSGKILISYTDRRYVPGASRTVTFEDFYIDSVKIEGTRKITNTTTDSTSAPQFRVEVIDGKLSWPDGTFATRNSNHTRTWTRAENPAQDESRVEGSAEGLTRKGEEYTSVVTDPLVFKRRCLAQRYFFPVSGVVETTSGENTMIIDFGDGECDNEATVTINGVTETITLDVKARKSEAMKRRRG